jgi:membrane fusion protein (multidrug efflux system)
MASAALLLAGCSKAPDAAPAGPPTVLVAEATQEDVPIFSEEVATLDGSTNAQIHAQVTGYLLSQNYKEGSQVKEGDLLFQIDPKPFQANLDKAQANLQNNQAQLLRTQQDLGRYEALVKQGAVSQQEYQNEVQTVQSAQANVDAANASVATAQIELGYTKIAAPFSGIVGKANPNIGDLISPSMNMTTISALDPIKAVFTVPEQFYLDHAARLAEVTQIPVENRPANLELLLADGTVYPQKGRFDYVDRQIQTSTGAITVYALFPNADNVLRPGQYAKVRANTQNISNAVLIPQRAVNELQGTFQVVVIKPGNIAEIRNVTVGDRVGTFWVITSGVESGEHAVVEGIQKCQPDMVVNPQPYNPPADDSSTNAATAPAQP